MNKQLLALSLVTGLVSCNLLGEAASYTRITERTEITETTNGSVTFHKIYYHDGKLSLTLLQHGVDKFLDAIGTVDDQEYIHVLETIIACAQLNDTNVPQLFETIQNNLRGRINTIELERSRKINPWYLILGVGAVVIAGLAYAYYKGYSDLSVLKDKNFNDAFEQYQKDGVPVKWYGTTEIDYFRNTMWINKRMGVHLPDVDWSRHPNVTDKPAFVANILKCLKTLYDEKVQAARDYDSQSALSLCSAASACLGAFGFYKAIWHHHPWYENYLERYKELLIITEQMITSYSKL